MHLCKMLMAADSQGLMPSNFVPAVATRLNYSVGHGWNVWSKRDEWMPILIPITPEAADRYVRQTIARFDEIYRSAMHKQRTTNNDFAAVGAMNVAIKANEKIATFLQSAGVVMKVVEEVRIELVDAERERIRAIIGNMGEDEVSDVIAQLHKFEKAEASI